MALATRCPNCQALFRVVADQLKLRGGLVRCGACRHVFDAIGSLAYVDDSSTVTTATPVADAPASKIAGSMASLLAPSPAEAPAPARASPTGSPDETAADAGREDESGKTRKADAPREATPRDEPRRSVAPSRRDRDRAAASEAAESADNDALSPPTLLAAQAEATVDLTALKAATEPPAEEGAVEDEQEEQRRRRRLRHAQRQAHRAAEAEQAAAAETEEDSEEQVDEEAPEFLREERRRRGFSVVFGGGSALLLLLLVVQAAILFRTEIVTRWPAMRPTLVQLCGVTGCAVSWPTRADLLAVVGTELQAIPGTDVLELRTVIRNRASFKVALPAIEVTLTDTQNRTIARKVFAPVDYLSSAGEPASRIDEGLGAGSDYEVRIAFEARGVNAVGFVVYPFYL
jgi:predicted Zn finger-like uncharacterized protein